MHTEYHRPLAVGYVAHHSLQLPMGRYRILACTTAAKRSEEVSLMWYVQCGDVVRSGMHSVVVLQTVLGTCIAVYGLGLMAVHFW